jgi:hypothetical protein
MHLGKEGGREGGREGGAGGGRARAGDRILLGPLYGHRPPPARWSGGGGWGIGRKERAVLVFSRQKKPEAFQLAGGQGGREG